MERRLPHLRFDPEVDISPYALFGLLRDGRAPALYELRGAGGGFPPELTLRGARALPADPSDWNPPASGAVVFDRDGEGARALVVALRAAGRGAGVRALFGGLRLYEYALDPRVVGDERYLVRR